MKITNIKAFTLTEVLVATVLLVIIAVALFAVFGTAVDNLRNFMELRTVSLILQEQASALRDYKFSDIPSMGTSFSPPEMASLTSASGSITQSSYSGRSEMRQVTFKIDWTTYDGRTQQRTLTTLVTDSGINKR